LAALTAIVLLADSGAISDLLFKLHFIPMGDKAAHFVLVGSMATLAIATLCCYWPRRPVLAVTVATLAVGVVATLEEASNMLVEHRSCTLEDLVANYLGILCLGTLPAMIWLALRALFRPTPDVAA